MMPRRLFLGLASSLAAAAWVHSDEPKRRTPHLAIGNYGMKSLRVEEAIREIAALGFGAFECCAIAEWDSTPANMSPDRRRSVAALLKDLGLRLAAVMENLPPQMDQAAHKTSLARMQAAIELGQDLMPDRPPLVQTVLGGGRWDDVKGLFRDRVGEWLTLAKQAQATICIKPHRFGAMSTPEQAVWLIDQLGKPSQLRIVYDYSHYVFRDISIESSITQAQGLVSYVAMKDAVQSGEKVSFALPGETRSMDHAAIRKALKLSGFHGDYCCEVSSQISQQSGYDPIAAAKTCYLNLAEAFAEE